MNPEWLPEMALLLAGVLAGAIALRFLFTRQPGRGIRAGAIGIACIALAFVLAGAHESVRSNHAAGSRRVRPNPLALVPAAPDSTGKDSESVPTMSLLLGDVLLRVAPSDRYVFSADGKPFLELDSLRSGLTAGCVVAVHEDTAAGISRNTSPFREARGQFSRLDAHTLRVQEEGEDVFRVHYAEPHKIEVTGSFFVLGSREPSVVSFENGIRWSGGGIAPGTTVDLTRLGKGRIDFGRSGLIEVRPHSPSPRH
jgi:hypothetical protein